MEPATTIASATTIDPNIARMNVLLAQREGHELASGETGTNAARAEWAREFPEQAAELIDLLAGPAE